MIVAGAVVLGVGLLFVLWSAPGGGQRDAKGPARERAAGPAVGWGFTHTQFSADRGADAAVERAARVLAGQPMAQNQHLMGWGAGNPEPSPGRYDFDDLDRRMALIRRTGGTPVLTLCCAPDWMKGGTPGRTDWSRLEKAPEPDHYPDFAALAGKVARRYPEIRHFVVWNEFKGFFDDGKGRWDAEDYTRLYNLVYQELKKVNPHNQVGGPYLVMDSYVPGDDRYPSALKGTWGHVDQRTLDAFAYWNRHKAGADFLVVDGSSYSKDDRYAPGVFTAARKFAEVGQWLRRTSGLPLWWAEWYVEVADEQGGRRGWSERERVAAQATALIEMAEGGASGGFYWNPERDGKGQGGKACPGCLWSSTESADGGRELPMWTLLARFSRAFPPDAHPREMATGSNHVLGLSDGRTALLVNTADRPGAVRVGGKERVVDGYGVVWVSLAE
ncbi:xylan 1,4-beta-xylosidase [Streptomyces endophytica]|uniref:Xylan 1,4-beta-xylosidase n=1 Tax=Streptomyces endophytica TaxID=2991496 RepID=A0ABY6PEW5_9ACTN|nr:xylan 1,4-beta-xylosidase [Streptomyces endophytica]UZJ32073.1 xylan 1,4-beta-xylosidase [Streptomyces endophytica]